MDRNRFNLEVRPHLTEIPIGRQGIGFDRLELDAWVDEYKARNGRPKVSKGVTTWDATASRASSCGIDKRILGRRVCQSTGTERLVQWTPTAIDQQFSFMNDQIQLPSFSQRESSWAQSTNSVSGP
jgi:hypothetical protein